jgi:MFS family permease
MAVQMLSVIVGWQIYAITKDPLALGLIGLAEAIPFISAALYAGHIADIFQRKKIILVTATNFVICATALALISSGYFKISDKQLVTTIYTFIFVVGVGRAFYHPAQSALMAQIVPRELYVNSSTWNSTIFHIAAVSGPAFGGLLYGFFSLQIAYLFVVIFSAISLLLFCFVHYTKLPDRLENGGKVLFRIKEGIRFVIRDQVLLGAMSLDMFAVLFGGAVAMLPVFASDILHTGPQGLGFLRAAPAIGAIIMALFLAHYPIRNRAGVKLLLSVAAFGICTIFFALSTNVYLSFFLLLLSGVFDNVSVIIRSTILQLFVPDEIRGRVASVNSIFIGSSNEIGSFESGLAARLLGLVPSVIFGGGMTLVVVGIIGKIAPKLRKLTSLSNS